MRGFSVIIHLHALTADQLPTCSKLSKLLEQYVN